MHRSALVLSLAAAPLVAQQPAADFRWEKSLPAGSFVSLHNLNGDIKVTPSTSGKIEIVGIKRGDRSDFPDITIEIVESSRGITACSMFRDADMECNDRGFQVHNTRRRNRNRYDDLRIDFEVKVPKELIVDAHAVSGNVRVTGAEGDVRAGSVSGDVHLDKLKASTVRASSVSGDVWVSIEQLSGDGRLSFSSVSGNVTAELPKNTDADISMRTVSGELESDFPLTLSGRGGRMSRHSLNATIGKGGRELEVHTVSGDVRLRTIK